MQDDYLARFQIDGFAVLRGVFDAGEIAELSEAFDRIQAQGMKLRGSFRHQNVLFRLSRDDRLGKIVRLMQWPSYIDETLNRFRLDSRLLDIVSPLIGHDVKQVINQMHWKPPGAAQNTFGYHQDIWFRRPRSAYRNPQTSYVQIGIAIDPHSPGTGAMTICPGSHRLGELSMDDGRRVMDRPMDLNDLRDLGLNDAKPVTLNLEPGDIALWNLFTVHGSGANNSDRDRRFYINGYVSATDCDRGEWAFRDGAPCQLGSPALVHYDDLFTRPEPHYLDEV